MSARSGCNSGCRQGELGTQSADRRCPERQAPAIKARQFEDDRQSEPGPRLAFVEAAAALGGDLLGSLAKQAGMGQGELAGSLADMLPQLIDRMTPDGQVPAAGAMPDLGGLLGSLLRR